MVVIKYYALDYINGQDGECELVYGDQLYHTEDDAAAAREATGRSDLFDITWYGIKDLEDIYNGRVDIDEALRVHTRTI